jgi:hypothetical protein
MVLLTETAAIQRYGNDGVNNNQSMQTIASSVPCLSLPMHHQTAIENGFSLGRAYDIYFDDSQDVRTGDKVVIGSESYVVKAVQPYHMPLVAHLRCLTEQEVRS